jgi:hypothetical protein
MTNGWTAERRARQAELIRTWRPWEKSTGPRTCAGKARTARNAFKGGQRAAMREFSRLVNAEVQSLIDKLASLRR